MASSERNLSAVPRRSAIPLRIQLAQKQAEAGGRLTESLCLAVERNCCVARTLSLEADSLWRVAETCCEVAGFTRRVADSFYYRLDPLFRRAEAFDRAVESFRDKAAAFSRTQDDYCHRAETVLDRVEAFRRFFARAPKPDELANVMEDLEPFQGAERRP